MRYVKPHYYENFKCVADKCPDTCCAGWQIVIDEESLERYGHSYDNRLKGSIDWSEGCFYQYNGRCAMLNDKNLCDLVIAKGEDWLCDTCNRYPRHIEEFDGLREMSLSLSCPIAADIMLQCEETVRFIVEEDEEPDPLEEEFDDFDFMLYTQLEDARRVLFEIVQNRHIPIMQRMAVIMEMARKLQDCVDEERLFDMEEVICEFADGARNIVDDEEESLQYKAVIEVSYFKEIEEGFVIMNKLERLREEWSEVLEETYNTLYKDGPEHYTLIYNAFQEEFCKNSDESLSWDIFQEQILMFFLFTYFCGAVYDDCIYSKVALAVFSAFYIQEFVMCKWFLADKRIDRHECIGIAYRYAREVEHSDDNLNLLEEWFMEKM